MKLIKKNALPCPFYLELLAALERILCFCHMGNTAILATSLMNPLYLSRAVIKDGFPMLCKVFIQSMISSAMKHGFEIDRRDWPLKDGYPAIALRRAQILTYSLDYFMVRLFFIITVLYTFYLRLHFILSFHCIYTPFLSVAPFHSVIPPLIHLLFIYGPISFCHSPTYTPPFYPQPHSILSFHHIYTPFLSAAPFHSVIPPLIHPLSIHGPLLSNNIPAYTLSYICFSICGHMFLLFLCSPFLSFNLIILLLAYLLL